MNNVIRSKPLNTSLNRAWSGVISQRGAAFGVMIIGALLAFEVFNYSTTEFALHDVLGDLKFLGMGWATILSIAFCSIDFAGIARLFTPEQGADEPAEVWYLFGAWLLAAAMNAMLTWWGVSVAIATHTSQGASIVSRATIQTVVPIFVAIMVWVIRVLIISTFSMAGDRMFSQASQRTSRQNYAQPQAAASQDNYRSQRPATNTNPVPRPTGLVPASSLHAQSKPLPRPAQNYQRSDANPRPTQNYQQRADANTNPRPSQNYQQRADANVNPRPTYQRPDLSSRPSPSYQPVEPTYSAPEEPVYQNILSSSAAQTARPMPRIERTEQPITRGR